VNFSKVSGARIFEYGFFVFEPYSFIFGYSRISLGLSSVVKSEDHGFEIVAINILLND
jgi:hypothetical protein